MTARTTSPSRRSIAAAYNEEWSRLVADPANRITMTRWPAPASDHADLDRLLAATSTGPDRPEQEADALLACLVRQAASDELAARLVLQRVIPGLIMAAVRRTSHRPSDRSSVFDDLTAAAWVIIRTYPCERRPARIASNILRDAEYQTFTRAGRLRSASEVLLPTTSPGWDDRATDGVGRPLHGDRHPSDEMTHLFALARAAGIPSGDLDLIDALYLAGHSVGEVASNLRVTPRTVYSRRVAITARLAEVAAA